jgi:hypothetical protein
MTAADVFQAIGEFTQRHRAGELSELEANDQIRQTIHQAFVEMPAADLLELRNALMRLHHQRPRRSFQD